MCWLEPEVRDAALRVVAQAPSGRILTGTSLFRRCLRAGSECYSGLGSMRALTFHAPRDVRYETVADPSLRSSEDALVRVDRSALCGSDLHPYRGAEKGLDPGTVLGHEFVGEVVEVGKTVAGLAPGDRVVSPFSTSCGRCFHCQRGLTCRCLHGQLFGWVEGGLGIHGAQAEYVRVPLAESTLVRVPEEIGSEDALFTGDILATGFFCAEMAAVSVGATVAVLGCGPVGLMACIAALELGAERVFAIDSVPERLELAAGFGAVPIHLELTDPAEVVREATDGHGVCAVLEAVGSPQATRLAVDLVRAGGTVAAAGVHTEGRFAFSPVEAYDKNLTYRAGRCPARAYIDRLLPLIAEGRYDLGRVISHRLPLEEGPRAYQIFDRKLEGCTKVIFELNPTAPAN